MYVCLFVCFCFFSLVCFIIFIFLFLICVLDASREGQLAACVPKRSQAFTVYVDAQIKLIALDNPRELANTR